MKYLERPLLFECGGERLIGILTRPEHPAGIGLVIVVGGPQYRAGAHRQFVLLARRLAAAGYPVLRFDYRGMGDSSGAMRSFELVSEDIGAAVDALAASCREVERSLLCGLCDAASAALLYWCDTRDPRIAGLVLLNPWVRSEASLARTFVRHYYRQRLLEPGFWTKLLRGELMVAETLRDFWHKLSLAKSADGPEQLSYQGRMAWAWHNFSGPILLILSGRDYTAKEFLDYVGSDALWTGALERPGVRRVDLPEADHTFSSSVLRCQVELAICHWLQEIWQENQERKCAAC